MREIQTETDGTLYLLSAAERRILEVIGESERPLSVKEICQRAGCTTRTYHYFMNRPNFRSLLMPALNYLVEKNLVQIFGTLIMKAKQGSQKHQELLFKTIGLLRENKEQVIQVFNFFESPEEQKYLTEERIDQLLGEK